MKLQQCTRTIIKAEDGKILRKKTTGAIVGDTLHLGYNYYEAGVPLAEARLSKPEDYEEIDIPEDYIEVEIINQPKRLAVMARLFEDEKKVISTRKLTGEEMLAAKILFPRWGEDVKEGDEVTKGLKFQYEGKLYAVLQDHKILPYYYPSENTSELYVEVTADYIEEDESISLIENPIQELG